MKRLLSALFVSAFVLGGIVVSGCDSSGGTGSHYQERTINASSGLTAESLELFADLSVSKAEAFSAVNVTVIPSGAKVRVWADTDVVSFIENPEEIANSYIVKFKPNRQGEFTVNAESGSVKKTVTIKVTSKLSSITVTGSADPIDVGKTVQLKANKNPSDSPATVTWASSDANVATVDQNGLVTAKAAGVATITATSTDTETDTYNGADIVSGYFDVTVKGFYLSDTSFFLCNKDQDDEVVAKVVGISGSTVAWESSDTNLFTVIDISTDKKSAKLKYKDGAAGEGTVTAKLKDGSGNVVASATARVYVYKYYMLALGDSIAAGYAPKPMGGKAKDEDMEEKDMVAAYEKYMNRRKGGGTDPNYVNQFSYPAVLKTKLSGNTNITLQSYARTGDQTKDLLAKLDPNYRDAEIATKKGEILEAVKQADYITLCIGANDILQRATGINIFMKDLNWFRDTFNSDLEKCKANFDTILGTLADNGATVYVMSVYSPYHYFTGNPPIPDSQYTSLYKSTTEKIVAINGIAEGFLRQLNEYISGKAAANPHVEYVDVADVINKEALDTHKTLIHADPEKFNLDALVSTFGQTIPIWFDPHPKKAGAVKIADTYKDKFTTTP